MKTKKTDIDDKLWDACNIFRNTIDSNQYKDYILSFLFLKYISDIYENNLEKYKQKYKGNQEKIKRFLKRDSFVLDPKCTFSYIFENREKDNIGEVINKAFQKVEDNNREKLKNVFRNVDFNNEAILGEPKLKIKLLRSLINHFKDIDFKQFLNQSDIIGRSYLFLISKFASEAGKKGGEFFTPSEVSELLAKIINPQSGDTIYDPACGSGSLLIKARKEIKDDNFALYGQEVNGGTWALAKMNMFLNNISASYIEWGDVIRSPKHKQNDSIKKFHKVIANPPFSKKEWGFDSAKNDSFNRFHRGVPPSSKGDWAFISHMVESLLPNGVAGVVVPQGVLFRESVEGKIRKSLIEENMVQAVISLPQKLFFGTGISTSLLILHKQKKDKSILFIDAGKDFQEGSKQNTLRDKDIKKVITAYKKRKPIDKYAHLASLKEIKNNNYNLSVSLYVSNFEEEEKIDIKKTQKEIEELEKELSLVSKKTNQHLKDLKLI